MGRIVIKSKSLLVDRKAARKLAKKKRTVVERMAQMGHTSSIEFIEQHVIRSTESGFMKTRK